MAKKPFPIPAAIKEYIAANYLQLEDAEMAEHLKLKISTVKNLRDKWGYQKRQVSKRATLENVTPANTTANKLLMAKWTKQSNIGATV